MVSLNDPGMRGSSGAVNLVRNRSSGLVMSLVAPIIGLPVNVLEVRGKFRLGYFGCGCPQPKPNTLCGLIAPFMETWRINTGQTRGLFAEM